MIIGIDVKKVDGRYGYSLREGDRSRYIPGSADITLEVQDQIVSFFTAPSIEDSERIDEVVDFIVSQAERGRLERLAIELELGGRKV